MANRVQLVVLGLTAEEATADDGAKVFLPYGWSGELPESEMLVVSLPGLSGSYIQHEVRSSLNKLIDDGGRVVIVGHSDKLDGEFFMWLQKRTGVFFRGDCKHDCVAEYEHLKWYFRGLVSGVGYEWIAPPENLDVLAVGSDPANDTSRPVAIRFSVAEAEVIFLPMPHSGNNPVRPVLRLVDLLPTRADYPPYLDEILIGDEANLRSTRTELLQRLESVSEGLAAAACAKRILYFTGRELEQEVVRFLASQLRISAVGVPGNNEDFHLLEDGVPWVIGEVKATRNNVTRGMASQLDVHRENSEFPDDFPALLVVNSFVDSPSVIDRDQPVHPDLCRHVAKMRLIIVRTLDLINILQAQDKEPRSAFLDALMSDGGWFEVQPSGDWKLHTGA